MPLELNYSRRSQVLEWITIIVPARTSVIISTLPLPALPAFFFFSFRIISFFPNHRRSSSFQTFFLLPPSPKNKR